MNGPVIRLFVYGTLKRGYWNHDDFCREAILIEPATVLGRLYELPSGIPVLEVPSESIIAVGSADIGRDAPIHNSEAISSPDVADVGSWNWVEGELVVLPEPCRTIPPIDHLEGYCPGGASSYRRVLLSVQSGGGSFIPAWCYVATRALLHAATPLGRNVWP